MKDMTSPSIFTSIQKMLQIRVICQISKKGIHYSSIQGHLFITFTVKMNRNRLGLNLKVVWNTLLCLKTSSNLQ
ncbi:hypothetical protein T02_14663, partial [Trichinella nativa]